MSGTQSYSLEKIKFLVVDANEGIRFMLTGILRALGVRQIHTANNGEDAIEELSEMYPDIIRPAAKVHIL